MTTKSFAHLYVILSNLPLILPALVHVSWSTVCSRKPSPVYGRYIYLFGSYSYFSKKI